MTPLMRHEALVGRLDGLFDEFFRPAFVRGAAGAPGALPIRADVKENAEAYVVQAELPGVKKEDIQVEVEGNEVSLRAERRFALPQEIDDGKAEARFADGVLELTLPKKAPATGRKVEVN